MAGQLSIGREILAGIPLIYDSFISQNPLPEESCTVILTLVYFT
jgi:hypothetical protein